MDAKESVLANSETLQLISSLMLCYRKIYENEIDIYTVTLRDNQGPVVHSIVSFNKVVV